MIPVDPCADDCICKARPVTAGGMAAAEEQAWLKAIIDAAEEQVRLYRVYEAAVKSERDDAYEAYEAHSNELIARFFPGAGTWSE